MDPDDREHSILPKAFTWEIVGLNLQRVPSDGSEPYLDLKLRRSGAECRLRFWSPRQLLIEEGGPTMTAGLTIKDISHRGWEGVGVRVDDFEASGERSSFWRGPSSVSRDPAGPVRSLRLTSGVQRKGRIAAALLISDELPFREGESPFRPGVNESGSPGQAVADYCFGWGMLADSWWNTAIHLPFFFVHTVDAQTGLGMGCPW